MFWPIVIFKHLLLSIDQLEIHVWNTIIWIILQWYQLKKFISFKYYFFSQFQIYTVKYVKVLAESWHLTQSFFGILQQIFGNQYHG